MIHSLDPPRLLRAALKAVTPAALRPSAWAERYLRRLQRRGEILAGPFAGMQFAWDQWDPYYALPIPKCIGTYERELHPIIEQVIALEPDLIVDVGAAEGYYAIGLARRCPSATVVAFEELAAGRALMQRLAAANGVARRLEVRGRCEPTDLSDALRPSGRRVVLMDVEGYEHVLLDSTIVPALAGTHILVEAHDCYVPGVGAEICRRFDATHAIDVIPYRTRCVEDAAGISMWMKVYAKYNVTGWMGERLHAVTWFYLRPRGSTSA